MGAEAPTFMRVLVNFCCVLVLRWKISRRFFESLKNDIRTDVTVALIFSEVRKIFDIEQHYVRSNQYDH